MMSADVNAVDGHISEETCSKKPRKNGKRRRIMKRPVVRKNLLSTAFAIAAFAAPNLVRAFAQCLSHYESPLPRFCDTEGTLHCGFWAPDHRSADSVIAAPLYVTRTVDIHKPVNQLGSLCSNPVLSICLVRNIR
jgi:hypothetical protein